MMFSRGLSLCLALCLTLVLLMPTAAGAQEEAFLPDGSGDILLVHSRTPDEDARLGVEKLVTLGAALRKVVDYGTPEQCGDVLDQYEYVICYDLDTMDAAFEEALKSTSAHLMIIGGTAMARYLDITGSSDRVTGEERQKNGRLTYTFPTGQQYEAIVRWDHLYSYASDGYESGTIQIGTAGYPFCSEIAGVRFIPICDLSQTLVLSALVQEIVQWMWPYENRPTDYAQFLVLDAVYPFMSADSLMELVEQVEETSVPYVISVMPLNANNDYPAMTQFCQVLAYAQSKGATIVLHAPIIHKTVEEPEELYEKLTEMTMAYIQNGVYPVGIQVPFSWINQEPYLTVLKRYRTVFVYDDGAATGFDLEAHTSQIARQGHQLVYPLLELDQAGISQLECFASATYADCAAQRDAFLRYAGSSKTGGKPYMDLRDYNHSVWLDTCVLTYRNRTAYVDGKMADTTFQPTAYDTEYDFGRSPLVRMSVDLKNQNRFLMAVVLILTIIFISFIAYARHRMRKRFFSAPGKEE